MMPEVSMVRLAAGITLSYAASGDPSGPPLVLLPAYGLVAFLCAGARSVPGQRGAKLDRARAPRQEQTALKERLAEVDTKLAAFTKLG
jgi:hypothetical protein